VSSRDPLFSLYLVSLIGALGFSIVLPFLVFRIEDSAATRSCTA
jgi:hypothetical protein